LPSDTTNEFAAVINTLSLLLLNVKQESYKYQFFKSLVCLDEELKQGLPTTRRGRSNHFTIMLL